MVYRTIMLFLCLSLIFSGCAIKHAKIDDHRTQVGCSEVLVGQTEYSSKGLPLFLRPLGERPNTSGDRFTLVQFTDGQPTKSYDIAVVGPESDFTKPFKVVYEWTGRGFVGGAQATLYTTDLAMHAGRTSSGKDTAVVLAFAVAPLVLGTVGGFVVGVADGIRATAEEVGKVILGKQELIVAYTTYEYDALSRLAVTRMYKADDTRQELVRTEYAYQAAAAEPQKTTITTFPDGAVRIVE
jgi:hypothetical protein